MDNLEKILSELHEAVAEELLDRVRSGEATASEIGCALKLLKDNNITIPEPEREDKDSDIMNLAKFIPGLVEEGSIPNANVIRETLE